MMKIPARFNRANEVGFDEFFRAGYGGGQENTVNLSALVRSFLERDFREQRTSDDWNDFLADEADEREVETSLESRRLLEALFARENDASRRKIHAEVEEAVAEIGGERLSPDFKLRLVDWLRGRGLDAGFCKSKCEKDGRRKYRDHEYVDVNDAGNRYIVELFLAGEFTIAHPTDNYAALLETFPPIFVGKPDELRQVVRTMCEETKISMKRAGDFVPPWRRLKHMQSKWFGLQHRIPNEIVCRKAGGDSSLDEGIKFYFRDVFATVTRGRKGNLSAILNQQDDQELL